ncbi:MAG: phosphoglucosamine mutase [Tissierellia bacterium]|jgi:phosphoglucosamine mutase|nr:phosphoglucosamine mutase [Tissierellia bacterium]
MSKLFGTDGVRGIANVELTPELAYKIGRAGAYVLTHGEKGKVLIGRDTRASGDMLEAALTAGFCSMGIDVISLGIIPTPAVAYLTRKYEALASVVISASHNPGEYNGIKLFNKEGFKLSDEIEDEIEDIILNNKEIDVRPTKDSIGKRYFEKNGANDYKEFLKSSINVDLSNLTIAMDCGNGALYKIGPEIMEELGATVIAVNTEPNGMNINDNCGSTNPAIIQKLVLDTKADIGLSFDGDADRIIAVDEKGKIIDGDHILAICGRDLKNKGTLKNNTVVGTVMTNMGLDLSLKENDIEIVKTKVGDRYILEEMINNGYSLGGEQSGHIIFLDYNTTGDGLATGLYLLDVFVSTRKPLSELNCIMKDYPQVLINARVNNGLKYKYMENEEIKKEIERIESLFEGQGRVVIRPSGTEPLVRVMIEGKDQEEITRIAQDLASFIEERMNVE